MRSVLLLMLFTAFAPVLAAQQAPTTAAAQRASAAGAQQVASAAAPLPTGTLLAKVVTIAAPEQSYALYLPAKYSAAKRWPIVYAFDPGAHGEIPAGLMQAAAEEFGYIVAASNNSKNGPWKPEGQAAQAVWNDTHDRLSIDEQRIYFAGLSGGARVASQLAQSCRCAQAVFLSGAGFSSGPPSSRDSFGIFLTTGYLDFNYPELVGLDAKLEVLGIPHFLRRFSGGHQWAPAEIWPEALAWAELLAIKNKQRERGEKFISEQLARFTMVAQKFEEDGELYYAWQYLRGAAGAFAGLTDLAAVQARITALGNNPVVRTGEKREKENLAEQKGLEDAVYKVFAPIDSPNADRNDVVLQTTQEVVRLRDRAAHEKNEEEGRVLERARRGVFAYFIESGEPLIDSSDPRLARIYIALAAEARPESAWPQVSLARCDLKMGRKKDALHDLQKAVAAGLTAGELAQLPSESPEFANIVSDAEFQKLAATAPNKPSNP